MHRVSLSPRVSVVNVSEIAGNTPLPYISFVKTSVAKPWKEVSEAAHFPSWRPHVEGCGRKGATETETKERDDGGWSLEESAEEKREIETEKEREREGMSFPLKKSCPNKGALFHAQCTLPQTRSLRYLSLRGARCFSTLSTPHEFLSLFSFPFETLENGASFLMGLCLSTCEVSARCYRSEMIVGMCDNSLISPDVS